MWAEKVQFGLIVKNSIEGNMFVLCVEIVPKIKTSLEINKNAICLENFRWLSLYSEGHCRIQY